MMRSLFLLFSISAISTYGLIDKSSQEFTVMEFMKIKSTLRNDRQKLDFCPLTSLLSDYVRGINDTEVRVERSFTNSMSVIIDAASSCNTIVWVTSSFRRAGTTPSGAVVPPATHSNHFVGHAIDFNLQTRSGWCNSKCLRARTNEDANCFINEVKRGNLRWGGDFTVVDPVHIDDDLYLDNPSKWMKLYYELQKVC